MDIKHNKHMTASNTSLPSAIDTTQPTSTNVSARDSTGATSVHDPSSSASSTAIPSANSKSSSIRSTRSLHSLVLRVLADLGNHTNTHTKTENDKDNENDENDTDTTNTNSEDITSARAHDDDGDNDSGVTDLDESDRFSSPSHASASSIQLQRLDACQRALEEMMTSIRRDDKTALASSSRSSSSSTQQQHVRMHQQQFHHGHRISGWRGGDGAQIDSHQHNLQEGSGMDDEVDDDGDDGGVESILSSIQLHKLLHLPRVITNAKLINVARKGAAALKLHRRNGTDVSIALRSPVAQGLNSTRAASISIPSGVITTLPLPMPRRAPKRLAPLIDVRSLPQPQPQPLPHAAIMATSSLSHRLSQLPPLRVMPHMKTNNKNNANNEEQQPLTRTK